jgi:hypothetical protein
MRSSSVRAVVECCPSGGGGGPEPSGGGSQIVISNSVVRATPISDVHTKGLIQAHGMQNKATTLATKIETVGQLRDLSTDQLRPLCKQLKGVGLAWLQKLHTARCEPSTGSTRKVLGRRLRHLWLRHRRRRRQAEGATAAPAPVPAAPKEAGDATTGSAKKKKKKQNKKTPKTP